MGRENDKIKRKVMINDFKDGGLRMLDIESFNKALKCSWIKKYLDDENKGKWKLFLDLELECFRGKMFFTYDLSKNDLLNPLYFEDPFLKEVLNIWTEVNFEPQLKSVEHIHSRTLWFNSVFKIAKKTFFYSDWFRSGINQVRDLLKDDNSFLSYQEFKAKFKFTPCPLTYCGVISMLKIVKKSLGSNPTESMKHEPMTSKLEKAKKASQLVYKVP